MIRASRWLAALTLAAAACADDPTAARVERAESTPLSVAAGVTVTNLNGDRSTGSLRWAIDQAAEHDTIRFAPEIAGGTIALDTTVVVYKALVYDAPAGKGITISGSGRMRLFRVLKQSIEPKKSVFRNVTLRDGSAPGGEQAGAIWSNAILVLENSTVTANSAQHISALSAFELTLVNSTVSGNVVRAGAVYPAVQGEASVTLINSTVAANTGQGVWAGAIKIQNSVLAGNSMENCAPAGKATVDGAAVSDDATCGAGAIVADPKLLPLADNGGPTMTHALDIGSPAMDAGKFCTVTEDQRHVARGAACDAGAFEFTDYTTVSLVIDDALAVNPATGWVTMTGSVQCSREDRLDVGASVEQGAKGRTGAVTKAEAAAMLDCGPAPRPWSLSLAPATGGFTNGTAAVRAATRGTAAWVTPASVSGSAKLYWAHR